MKIIKSGDENLFLNTAQLGLDDFSVLGSKAVQEILSLISNEPLYPKEIARRLGLHEQNIYYYIRKLENSGIIRVFKQEVVNGTLANFYGLSADSFFIKFGDFREGLRLSDKSSEYLSPFLKLGELDAIIVVGSPDPHGPLKARSKDGYFGMDLALFLGSYLNYIPRSRVRLDTEVFDRELKENNLIVIGGPIVNKVSDMINASSPIRFDLDRKGIYSEISSKSYFSEETGFISLFESPFNSEKKVLYLAGIRNLGTRATILAFLKYFQKIEKGNMLNSSVFSNVVEGVDLDSDGMIDDLEFLE